MAEIADWSTDALTVVLDDVTGLTITSGTNSVTIAPSGVVATDGTSTALLDPSGVYDNETDDVLASLSLKATLAYDDTSPKTLFTVPAGERWFVKAAIVTITEAFDGGSADLDIGVGGGGDADGYIDGATLTLAAVSGLDADGRGVLLYDSGNGHDIIDSLAAGATVAATITPGSDPGAGAATVHLIGWRVAA